MIHVAQNYVTNAKSRRLRGRRRNGAILMIALVGLVIGVSLLASFTAIILSGRETLRAENRHLQAQWLAESAIERAAAQLAADPKYAGERWAVSAEQIGSNEGGVVEIRVESVPDLPAARRISVQADYPDDPTDRCRQSKQVTLELSNKPAPTSSSTELKPAESKPAEPKPAETKPAETTSPEKLPSEGAK
jgi:hypothetical protein